MALSKESRRWLAAALVVLAVAAATFLTSEIVFQTNDDNSIVSAASGGVTGEPYPGNGFTSYLYGMLLCGLYRLSGSVPWHSLLLVVAQLLSLTAIMRSLFFLCEKKGLSPLWGLVAFLALYLGLGVKFMTRLQFTATPGYCAGALAALLWTLPEGKRARCFCCGLGFGLMGFAMLLRLEGGLLALPVPLMAGAVRLIQREKGFVSVLSTCAAIILFTVAAWGLNSFFYRRNQPDWEELAALGEASTVLLDYHNNDEAYLLAEQVTDWSPELIRCIRNWNLFLDERFNLENLTALAAAIQEAEEPPSLYTLLYKTGSVLKRYPEFSLIATAFCVVGLWSLIRFFSLRQWINGLLLLGLAGSTLLVIAYFYGWLNRFPDRVAFAYAWPVYCMALLLFLESFQWEEKAPKWATPMGVLLLAVAALATFGAAPEDMLVLPGSGRDSRAALTLEANAYAAAHPQQIYVTDVTQSFYAFSVERPPVNLLEWGSGMIHSAMYKEKMARLGYPQGLTSRNLADEKVRLLLADAASLPRLMDCLHADVAPWQAVLEAEEGMFKVYRLE